MDVTYLKERAALSAAVAACDDFTTLADALARMATSGVEAVVVRNGGPPGQAEVARFAAALIVGAREAQRRATVGET